MKKLKLKVTMIITIIAILMMNMTVFATIDMTTTIEGKEVVVNVKIDSNIEEAYFELEYEDDVYDYISSSAGEYANAKNGKVRVQVGTAELKANNYVVTFTFKYTGEDKNNTSPFTVSNIDFTNKSGEPVVEPTISKNVEIKIEEPTKPTETTDPTVPEESVKLTEPTIPTENNNSTQGEVSLNDEKPEVIPQAGSLTFIYVAGSIVILMIVGLVIINNKRK